jgi:hypothetical protein
MVLFSPFGWLTAGNRKSGVSWRDSRQRQHRPRPRRVRRLEALEGRLAPAVLTVNTLAEKQLMSGGDDFGKEGDGR